LNPAVFQAELPRRPNAGRGIRSAMVCGGKLTADKSEKGA
jgi:hypothetical protein